MVWIFVLTHARVHVGGTNHSVLHLCVLFVVPFRRRLLIVLCMLTNALSYLVARAATSLRCG